MRVKIIDIENRASILTSIQRALLGEISPEMRAISVEWFEESIKLWVYHDGELLPEVAEDFDAGAITQIYADFPYQDFVDFEFVRIDFPERIRAKGQLLFESKQV